MNPSGRNDVMMETDSMSGSSGSSGSEGFFSVFPKTRPLVPSLWP